jgi:hypothetical protein
MKACDEGRKKERKEGRKAGRQSVHLLQYEINTDVFK